MNGGAGRRFFERRQREERNVVHRDITFPARVRARVAFFEIKWKTSLSGVRHERREGENRRKRENRSRRDTENSTKERQREALLHLFLVSFSRAVSFSQPTISPGRTTENLSPSARSHPPLAQPPSHPLTYLFSIFLSFPSFQRSSSSPLTLPGLCSALYFFRARNHRERKTPFRSPKENYPISPIPLPCTPPSSRHHPPPVPSSFPVSCSVCQKRTETQSRASTRGTRAALHVAEDASYTHARSFTRLRACTRGVSSISLASPSRAGRNCDFSSGLSVGIPPVGRNFSGFLQAARTRGARWG